jgi:hypothetical protein
MAIVGGRVVFEYGNIDTVSYVASVRKSILSMLYGVHVQRGQIDLDATLTTLGIDDRGSLTAMERQARVRDLLTARSGVFHSAANDGDDLARAPARGTQRPGTYFLYNNRDFNVLGTYVGRYELAPGAIMTITLVNGRLFAQLTGQRSAAIFPESETEFFYHGTNARISFTRDASGSVTGLLLRQSGGRTAPARKMLPNGEGAQTLRIHRGAKRRGLTHYPPMASLSPA